MERYLAHRIIFRGRIHTMAVLEIRADADGRYSVEVSPFRGEIHSTVFHSGTVTVRQAVDGARPELEFS